MLLNFNIQVPEIIKLTKLKMEAVLAQYFHKDGSVPFFNGTNNYNLEKIKLTFGEKQNIRKIKYPAETNGLFFFEDKNKKIFFDCVQYLQICIGSMSVI